MARMMMLKAAVVLRFLGKVAMGCWAWSGTMLLGCVLLYWVYGGFFALLLLCIALAGTHSTINTWTADDLIRPLPLQESSTTPRTSYCTTQSSPPTLECLFPSRPCSVFRMKIYSSVPSMVPSFTCSSWDSRPQNLSLPQPWYFFMEMLETWATGILHANSNVISCYKKYDVDCTTSLDYIISWAATFCWWIIEAMGCRRVLRPKMVFTLTHKLPCTI